MTRNPLFKPLKLKSPDFSFGHPQKKKRNKLTPSQKLWVWENIPQKCHICRKRIEKQSDAEFDHIRAHSKGGIKMKLSHKFCNRLKSNKGLKKFQRTVGIKIKKTIKKKKPTKKGSKRGERPTYPLSIKPLRLPPVRI